ncbi:MAG: DUF6868 family protein [Campylobacterota bacterium]
MNLQLLQEFLLWSLLLNLAMLSWWFFIYSYKKEFVHRLHRIWFDLSDTDFDRIHYSGMALYKILIFVFNLIPLLVLHLIA